MRRGQTARWVAGAALAATGLLLPAARAGDGRTEIAPADFAALPYTYTITQPGSYVLTDTVRFTKELAHGIMVVADNVTLDLNGFALIGPGANSGYGIFQPATNRNLTVRNGSITGWKGVLYGGLQLDGFGNRAERVQVSENYYGMTLGPGALAKDCVACSNSLDGIRLDQDSLLIGCRAANNGSSGISADDAGVLVDCEVRANAAGISASWQSVVKGCVAEDNAGHGIFAGMGSVISECGAIGNGAGAFAGIFASGAAVVEDCLSQNSWSGIGFSGYDGVLFARCSASSSGGDGFNVAQHALLVECEARNNSGDGMQVGGASRVTGNTCSQNDASGIRVSGAGSYLADNQLMNNEKGIWVTSAGHMIGRNLACDNTTTNYQFGVGNVTGPVTSQPTNENEHANFSF